MNPRPKQEFRNIKMAAVGVVVAVVMIAGWRTWQRVNASPVNQVNSFETCVAAGHPVRETFPEQCDADGQTFTNFSQAQQIEPPRAR